ncbi:Mur ligase [Cryomyces antarcticus]
MIQLGLSRITSLLAHAQPLPWRAIHVAGTNGKGSICAYISALLHQKSIRCGRFTSPHLIDRWDCITIDEQPVAERVFREVEDAVLKRNEDENIGASEFELLTATAFEVFARENVEVGVVEVGMGGGGDATNVLQNPLVAVISKIGYDHQAFLGDSIADIAAHKAGILKPGVPVVVDATNRESALNVIRAIATAVHARPVRRCGGPTSTPAAVSALGLEPHQTTNLAIAVRAVGLALAQLRPGFDTSLDPARPACDNSLEHLLPALKTLQFPGRQQTISIAPLTARTEPVLLDGAHNADSAAALAVYVDTHLRHPPKPIVWLIAATAGKDVDAIFARLVRPGDRVVATRFGPVDGMPWVRAAETGVLVKAVAEAAGVEAEGVQDLRKALRLASDWATEGPLVVAGSLYLVGDLLRLLRKAESAGEDERERTG